MCVPGHRKAKNPQVFGVTARTQQGEQVAHDQKTQAPQWVLGKKLV